MLRIELYSITLTMFRTSSRSLWGVTSRASSIRASQFLPRASIAPLLRQQRAVYSSKSDDENPPPPKQPIDIEAERKRGQELLQSNPSVVSSKSSVANAASTAQGSKSADQDMTSELKHDIVSFDLADTLSTILTVQRTLSKIPSPLQMFRASRASSVWLVPCPT